MTEHAHTSLLPCVGCGALVPDLDGPAHRYIGASPGCWAAYGNLTEKEAGDFRYMRFHGMTVDAYCAQHLGEPSPQALRSVAVHLVGLHLQLERHLPAERLYAARQRVASFGKQGKLDLVWLEPPASPGEITVLAFLTQVTRPSTKSACETGRGRSGRRDRPTTRRSAAGRTSPRAVETAGPS